MKLKSILDVDYYKLTMMQMAWAKHRDVVVRYDFQNRHEHIKLAEVINPYALRVQLIFEASSLRFQESDIDYLRQQKIFSEDFLAALSDWTPTTINVDVEDGQFKIWTEGPWWRAILWETMVLSIVNTMYNEILTDNKGLEDHQVWANGALILQHKAEIINRYADFNHDLHIVDFGTRRRYSADWQGFALSYFRGEIGQTLVGTSNVHFARQLGMTPIGTFAHEMDMVYAGIWQAKMTEYSYVEEQPFVLAHNQMLMEWGEMYPPEMHTALTDTWGTDFFFKHSKDYAEWDVRHDSGDPFRFVDRVDQWWIENRDDLNGGIVFSDGLDLTTILRLHSYCKSKGIHSSFGWGTNLMNDVGNKPISIVMKATMANGKPLVKLSDNIKKASGPAEMVAGVTLALVSGGKESRECMV